MRYTRPKQKAKRSKGEDVYWKLHHRLQGCTIAEVQWQRYNGRGSATLAALHTFLRSLSLLLEAHSMAMVIWTMHSKIRGSALHWPFLNSPVPLFLPTPEVNEEKGTRNKTNHATFSTSKRKRSSCSFPGEVCTQLEREKSLSG